jgi:exopolyphosphatase / guanosine-5'-triphosphate,3'-diphosphate pyrophosphatase
MLGVRPRVISGEEEAKLSFRGALSGLSITGRVVVFDIGGGSTEFIAGEVLGAIDHAVSLDLGSVRLHERHLHHDPPQEVELAALRTHVRQAIEAIPAPAGPCELVGVAGTVTTLKALELGLCPYDPSRVHGSRMSRASVMTLCERLSGLTTAERAELPGLEPGRADVIVAGAWLLAEVLEWAKASELVVSDRGVRWGLALDLAASTRPT